MRVPWKVPVMQAPVGPATTPELVSAVTGTGALGALAASWTEPETLRLQLRAIRAAAGVDYCRPYRSIVARYCWAAVRPERESADVRRFCRAL